MSEGLRALASKEGMTREQLTRFDREAILQMVGGMLAMPTPPAELVDFLHVESSGNPFFIAEYLRAAIAERILRRDSTGRWILDFAGKTDELRERVTLPPRIGSLVATRLRDLDSVALETLHAAAVLGRDFDVDLVARTAQLDVSAVLSAYATLSQRQILEEDPAGASRFAHDKLREIAYSEIEGSRRQYLHRCAAESIEARRAGRALEPHLGALGYHYAKADMAAPAARYFELAGHHARKSYANRDSSRLYKLALEQIEKAGGADGALAEAWCRVQEAIGDLLLLETESEQARAAFESALGHTPPIASVARAQRHRKVALTWERQHQHASALAAYEQAEIALGPGPNDATTAQAWWIERVQIEVDKAWDLYWMDDVEGLATLVTRVRPMIDEHGLAHQRAQFFQACVHMCFRRDRYVIDDETVQYARASLADAERARDIRGLAFARFCLAFTLLLKGCEAEAEPILAAGLSDSELVGDRTLRARYLSYRSMLLRRLGRAAEAAAVASDAAEIAAAVDALDYVGVAHSTLCWVAWREGDHAGVERHAEIATGAWRKLLPKYVYPLHWLVRVPRACHFVETGQWASACDEWRALLDPRQHRLPQPLAEAIDAAVGETDHGALARRAAAVIEHCKSYRYL
jgi:hypothetical protein